MLLHVQKTTIHRAAYAISVNNQAIGGKMIDLNAFQTLTFTTGDKL